MYKSRHNVYNWNYIGNANNILYQFIHVVPFTFLLFNYFEYSGIINTVSSHEKLSHISSIDGIFNVELQYLECSVLGLAQS